MLNLVLGKSGCAAGPDQLEARQGPTTSSRIIERRKKSYAVQPYSPLLPLLRPLSQQLIQIARSLLPPLRQSRFHRALGLDRSIIRLPVCILNIASCRGSGSTRNRGRTSICTSCSSSLTSLPLLLTNHRNPPLLIIILINLTVPRRSRGCLARQSGWGTTLRSSGRRLLCRRRSLHKFIIIPAEQLFPQCIVRAQIGAIPASVGCFFGERGADAKPGLTNSHQLSDQIKVGI